jgi:hypothetical protein
MVLEGSRPARISQYGNLGCAGGTGSPLSSSYHWLRSGVPNGVGIRSSKDKSSCARTEMRALLRFPLGHVHHHARQEIESRLDRIDVDIFRVVRLRSEAAHAKTFDPSFLLVLRERIELSTSPLPRECSTTELPQHAGRSKRHGNDIIARRRRVPCHMGRGPASTQPYVRPPR